MKYQPGTPIRLAAFNRPGQWSYDLVMGADADPAQYIRLSEFVDVEFPPRETDQVIGEKVQHINEEIAEATETFTRKVQELHQAKAELLALTHEQATDYTIVDVEVGDDISF